MAFKLFGQNSPWIISCKQHLYFMQAGNIAQNIYLQFQVIAIYEVKLANLDGSVNSNSEKNFIMVNLCNLWRLPNYSSWGHTTQTSRNTGNHLVQEGILSSSPRGDVSMADAYESWVFQPRNECQLKNVDPSIYTPIIAILMDTHLHNIIIDIIYVYISIYTYIIYSLLINSLIHVHVCRNDCHS